MSPDLSSVHFIEPLLVAILGPTGSGKTALSLEIASQFCGEIVNCDSVAIYREFSIGTAKPTSEEQARVPHHLFDDVDPAGYTTAGEYARKARNVIQEIRDRGSLPIVVGGTGLYLRALLDGLFPGPGRSEELRERLRATASENGAPYLHRMLQRMDSRAAEKIHANDVPKIIRAIEVSLSGKGTMTEQWEQGRDALHGFRVLRLGLDPDRALLYQRINRRVEKMFEEGLVEETEHLREKYGDGVRPLETIGYKQVLQLLRGEMNLTQAIAAVQQAQRNYSKRQMTWFRREPGVAWIAGFGDDREAVEEAAGLVKARL